VAELKIKRVEISCPIKATIEITAQEPLRRLMEYEEFEEPISEEVLKGNFPYGTKIKVSLKDDKLVFTGKARAQGKIREKIKLKQCPNASKELQPMAQ